MSESTIRKLIEARLRVVNEVNAGKLSANSGAKILGITRQGLWKLRRSVEKFRTDNGSEFKKHFFSICKRLGIEIKRNPVKHPTSNGKVERMHRTIEEECFWKVQAHKEDLSYGRYWLSRYLAWYNTKRKHGGYGMKGRTPQQRIENFILTNKSYSNLPDVNQTLILYKH